MYRHERPLCWPALCICCMPPIPLALFTHPIPNSLALLMHPIPIAQVWSCWLHRRGLLCSHHLPEREV